MREIKFRAWDKEKKIMIPNITLSGLKNWEGVNFYEWTQYTGLKDKNGKEIYEKDILGYWGGNSNGAKWIVGWDENKSGWAAVYGEDERTCSGESVAHMPAFKLSKKLCLKKEIIGNIYENPELLK